LGSVTSMNVCSGRFSLPDGGRRGPDPA
jgi:hypothetical protein